MNKKDQKIKKLVIIYTLILIISGATASFPKEGIDFIYNQIPIPFEFMKKWIALVYSEIINTPNHLIYGYDWLAFGHYAIAISFWGVYRNAKQNLWIVEWAMINSFLIIPFALTFGHFRGIPFWWQMVDCSFGVGSLILLFYLRNLIQKTGIKDMEKEELNVLVHF
jgi:hypothetical protein